MPNFISFAASIAELAHKEQSRTQSLNHLPSLFDAPGTEAFASEYIRHSQLAPVIRLEPQQN